MLKAAMTIPIYSKPISTLTDVIESELQVEIVDYVEYEGSFSQNQDSDVKKIYENRVQKEFSPFINVDHITADISVHINILKIFPIFQLENVLLEKSIVMDYWSGLSAIVAIKYSSSSGEPFVHLPQEPAYPPIYPNVWNFNWINKWRDQFDKVLFKFLILISVLYLTMVM